MYILNENTIEDYNIEILDESAKTDFIDKFGQDTFNNFEKAKQRLVNNGLSVDYGQYLKKDKKEVDELILSLYDDKKDSQKKRVLKGEEKQVRGRYKFFGEHGGYLIYQPLDYIASMDLGINTGWCTTGRYNHAGHPEYTPSESDAKKHFDDYTSQDIELYYFLNPNTFYGEYAIAYYPDIVDIDELDIDEIIYDKKNNRVIKLNATNFEMFDSEDERIWNEPKILDLARNILHLDLYLDYYITDKKVDDNGFEIANNELIKYWGNNTKVAIPDSVTSIGERAFNGCRSLTSITIPDSVTSIGYGAFYGCSGLTSITIGDSVKSIGGNAFRGCSGLTSITIESGVTSIGDSAFRGCSGLTSITIPNSITNIKGDTFSYCYNLASITIPDSVMSIGNSAFSGCSGLTSITIPNSVTYIGSEAFNDCSSLINITIPDSVTSIGKYAFGDCIGLTSIIIPDSVTSIGSYAFNGCRSLTSIIIPDSVTSIEKGAFGGCNSLESITIPNSVTSIGNKAFYFCSSLTSVTIGSGVTSIGSYAFQYCSGLTGIIIPDSVTSIGERAFNGCRSLTSITIPDSVTSIGYGTFYGCSGLTSITIGSGVTSIGYSAFYNCDNLVISTNNKYVIDYCRNNNIKYKIIERYLNEVYPNKGEDKEDFISRFMSATKTEYPDQKQRLAVAYSYWDRRNKKKLKEDFISVEIRPFEMEDILYWYNPEDGTCSAIIDYKKKKTRVRAGLLIIKNNKVLLCKDGTHFDLPGGSIEMGETIEEAAKREAQEEVNITAKNIRETGFDYCTTNDELEYWVAENVPEKYQWYNYYTCLCIGDYSSEFKGKVDAIDKDPEMKNSADWYDIDTIVDNPEFLEPWRNALTKFGYYNKTLTESLLKEDTRNQLISKSRNAGNYKDQSFGRNRFERKKYSKIATQVKSFNQINMDDFFKRDTLAVQIPVHGERDTYIVTVKIEGACSEIAKNIKLNSNKFEYKVVLQALTKVFNTANVYVNCTCDDYKYRFDHWNIVNNVSANDSAHDPGPGKGVANPKDEDGRGCKHVLLVLNNLVWINNVASVIKNYINWLDEHEPKLFAKLIFPKLYGMSEEDAIDKGLLPEDTKLETDKDILDKINAWAKNRGKYQPGSNKNPVTNTGGRAKKEEEKPEEEVK